MQEIMETHGFGELSMKIGDLVTHWVSKRMGVIIEIDNIESYKVKWFTESEGHHYEMFGYYDESRLNAVKKCP